MTASLDHPPRAAVAGLASLTVELVAGASTVTSARASSPMKLLTPRARGASVRACLSSFGGGLVAGDQTGLEVRIGRGAACHLGTQASTKVYRSPRGGACGHWTRAEVAEDGLLVLAPDAVQPFSGSDYTQRQEFHLATGAGLVLVDWLGSGRAECGERWAFRRYRSRNEIFVAGERRIVDSLLLDPEDGAFEAPGRTVRYQCLALLLVLGPALAGDAARLLQTVAARPVSRRASLVTSASAVESGALLRVAGGSVEEVGRELRQHLAGLASQLGGDPWERKW